MVARVYHSATSSGRTSTTSSTFATKVSLNFTPNANKTYAIFFRGWQKIVTTGADAYLQLQVAGTTYNSNLDNLRARDPARNEDISFFGFVTYTAGASPSSITCNLRYASNGTHTFEITDASLIALELGDNDFVASSTGLSSTGSTSYQTKLTDTLPAGARDYIVLWSAFTGMKFDSNDSVFGWRCTVGGTTVEADPIDHEDPFIDRLKTLCSARRFEASGGETVSIEYKTNVAATHAQIERAYILALAEEDFSVVFSTEDTAESSTTSSTEQIKSTLNFTSEAGVDYLIIQSAVVGADASSATVHQVETSLKLDGIVHGLESHKGASTGGQDNTWYTHGGFWVDQPGADTPTYTTRYNSADSSLTAKIKQSVIFALALEDTVQTYDESDTENIGVSDSPDAIWEGTDTAAEAGALSDTGARTVQVTVEASETLSITDDAVGLLNTELFEAGDLVDTAAGTFLVDRDATETGALADTGAGWIDIDGTISQALPFLSQAAEGVAAREEIQYPILVQLSPSSVWRIDSDVVAFSISRRLTIYPDNLQPGVADLEIVDSDGRYSPFVSSYHAGRFLPAVPIDILALYTDRRTNLTTSYYLFRGFIDSISVHPALPEGRRVAIACRDRWKQAQQREVSTEMFSDVQVNSLLATVFNVASLDVDARTFDAITDSLPFAWYRNRVLSTVVDELVEGGGYAAYVTKDGLIRVRDRYFDVAGEIVASYESVYGLSFSFNDADVVNRVTMRALPRQHVPSLQVVAEIGEAITLPAGTNVDFFVDYQDPRNQESAPATNVVTPAATTDWLANSAPTGSGSNLTSQVSLTAVALFGEAAKITMRYTGAGTAYLTQLRVRGEPVVRLPTLSVTQEVSSSQTNYGIRAEVLESRLFTNYTLVNRRATDVLDLFHVPTAKLALRVVDDMPAVLGIDLANVVRVTERFSGLDDQFTVIELNHDIRTDDVGWVHQTEMQLQRARTLSQRAFIISVSTLDSGDRLG